MLNLVDYGSLVLKRQVLGVQFPLKFFYFLQLLQSSYAFHIHFKLIMINLLNHIFFLQLLLVFLFYSNDIYSLLIIQIASSSCQTPTRAFHTFEST
jgi:hypothetical protein